MAGKPEVVVVLGPWSGGTSGVAGAIAALGAEAHPPFVQVRDPRTPVSYESVGLRRLIVGAFDHDRLVRAPLPPEAIPALRAWAGEAPLSVAKMPMLAFFIPEMVAAWSLRAVVVHRALPAIEATRARRGWPEVYGQVGAVRLYAEIGASLPPEVPRYDLGYEDLMAQPVAVGAHLAAFCGLPENGYAVARALSRPPQSSRG